MAVGGDVERVPADEDRSRPLVLPEAQQHVREADEGVARTAVRSSHRLRERVVGAVREGVTVHDEERPHASLALQLA